MQALSDEQLIERLETRMDRLETKVDGLQVQMNDGFAAVRSEARADFRTLLGILLAMFGTMILGFAGIVVQQVW